ncbi:MAG: aminoacyl-histidine dipeptidase [Bacilli bacterium]|jgi:dipeptidase D|nr:aminoacyl-histidine dipeptidase [Bacilli bacterium]
MDFYKNLDSAKVFECFKLISDVPRESKKEQKISDFLVNWAKERNLEVIQDEVLNVIIKKDGIGSLKDAQPVIVQAHMDMVCEKAKDSNHNFDTDPIEWVVKGDELYANNTTLGADNGIGLAMGMALLDTNDIDLPPLEVVATVDEETGMTGAHNLDCSQLKGKIFINGDSEEEGLFYLSCSGGNDTTIDIPVTFEDVEGLVVELDVTGGLGGHSGLEIFKERSNANKVMGRFLNILSEKEIAFNIIEINGGSKINVITRDNHAKIVIDEANFALVEEAAKTLNTALADEYNPQDKDVHVEVKKIGQNKVKAINANDSLRVVYGLVLVNYGPTHHSQFLKDLIQTSSNPGVIKTEVENNKVIIKSSLRSSIISQKQALVEQFNAIGKVIGANVTSSSFYPAWPYNENSKIKDLFVKEYKKLFNKDGEIVAIHAGLECGLFKEKMPAETDFISFGPTILGAHTAEEHVNIPSVERNYKLLKAVLQNIKEY